MGRIGLEGAEQEQNLKCEQIKFTFSSKEYI